MAFDLGKVIAEQARRKPFEFTIGPPTAKFSLPGRMDVRAIACLAAGDLGEGLTILLGEHQWEALKAHPVLLDSDALGALFQAYLAHLGTDLGELAASTRSSKSTARPSKPTSKGSTASRSRNSAKRR